MIKITENTQVGTQLVKMDENQEDGNAIPQFGVLASHSEAGVFCMFWGDRLDEPPFMLHVPYENLYEARFAAQDFTDRVLSELTRGFDD